MADYLISEAEESEDDEELEPHERKKLKKIRAVADSSEEEEEDDEEKIREELKDLIDDNPIDEDGDDSDGSDASDGSRGKRKRSDNEDDFDDRLEDDDYELLEENLGVKVDRRKRFKRLRRVQSEESEGEEQEDENLAREAIAGQLFEGGSDEETERRSERSHREPEVENFDEDEDEESDADDFIVDDDGQPIAQKKKKRQRIHGDATLQEGQDIFGVDFDYDEFSKYDDDEYEEEESDEYEEDFDGNEREPRPKKSSKKKTQKKSIFEVFEPSELKRAHFTDLDNEIRRTDIPERMQLREVPITPVPEGSTELQEEAEWIYKQAFCKPSVSEQEDSQGNRSRKPPSTVGKIKKALEYMRNQQLEVPFIAFYRKEYVQPELYINDLWKVYKYDAKWCQLLQRKTNLLQLFEKMRTYQLDTIMADPDKPLPEDVRILRDDDIDRLKNVQTPEELKDVHMHFLLHYSHEIPKMQDIWRQKEKERKKKEKAEAKRKALEASENATENGEDGAEPPPIEDLNIEEDEEEEQIEEHIKQAKDSGPYAMCRKAGICGFAKRFGLSPDQYAENLRDNYQRHEVDQEPVQPRELAKGYLCPKFMMVDEVMHAAKFVVARQIAKEPLLRKCVREVFYERAKINVRPTKKGIKEIDENHPCYTMKYLKNKPVRDLKNEQFLKLMIAEHEDKVLEIEILDTIEGHTSNSFLEEAKQLYQRDEFSKNVQEWNALRAECVEIALKKMVIPDLKKELRSVLIAEAKDFILKSCCKKLHNWIKIAPYQPPDDFCDEEDYDEWDFAKGIRVMGLAYVPDVSQAAFCAITSHEGEVTDYLRIPHVLKRKNTYNIEQKQLKMEELENIKNFVRTKKPHVIAIGGESREALSIQYELREMVKELVEEEQFPKISVEIVDNDLAKIYSNSKKGESDFREYPSVLKQAISIARRMQDPLVEFSQLCTADEEIMCLRYHPMQDHVNSDELLENLYLEFINRTNEVGVDINVAVQNSLTVNLVQFICGLGPRKGIALIKLLKQTNQRLENRTQLVTNCHMGPKVFINCSGFIKIDTNSLGDSTEAYVEVLDGSRVHPETYEWARKMAVDALEYDDDEANPAGALEEILESPERLKDLDLDAFAVELERQGFGNKSITLYDIRAELNCRYKDLRTPYRSPNAEELFDMLTKETPETFYVGKMVLANVYSIAHRKPQGEQLDQANPVRNEETGCWQCPFCLKDDFPELSEVWNHFDAGACPGQAFGVKVRLDNGLSGFIHIKNLSDKHVKNPEERVQINQTIHVRVTKIDVERFSVDCTSKSSDLIDKNNEWRPKKDPDYDQEVEDKDNRKEDDTKKNKSRQQYVKRVIVHPSFHNKSYGEVVKIMETMDQGEVIVRPSSKGSDHLTVTWKVTTDIYQHIDVREEGKENVFSLGQSLWIGNEEFEDLDEIIARHVNPMAGYARDLLNYKYYRDTQGGLKDKMEEILKEEKRKDPKKIHYFFSASKNYPGRFLLSCLPKTKCRHEYVTVMPEGFRYRGQIFDSINSLLKWFKEHFADPMPSTTPVSTPRPGSVSSSTRTPNSYATPAGMSSMSSDTINKVARDMPPHMLHSLAQVAATGGAQTPHFTNTPGGYGTSYINTPYTPSGQTPFLMTPYTPHGSQTPRYAPSPSSASDTNGPFIKPNAPSYGASSRHGPGSVHSSPAYGRSPRTNMGHPGHGGHRGGPGQTGHGGYHQENIDWQMANDAWASRKKPNSTPRDNIPGGFTPRGGHNNRTPRYDDTFSKETPQYDERPSSRSSRSGANDNRKSPRSIRSTPRTNTSPTSMTLGDSTPLYDEN
ncbi:transcription elongation factor SPT6 isoform X2 [Condylostylus longicornis]|uniref:transcription elongation factor SPT6 isoform X2 n=1 Tax=Condylostylus longicornis TaxID=2530218 RepID=UPI00244DA1BB|nr:transcription elongation factor SPT6 isoform X2 [Condylostylus longicornis]